MCQICENVFSKISLLNISLKKNYLTTPRICPDCGKMSGKHLKEKEKNEILSSCTGP